MHEKQTLELEKIVQEFPYFQSARSLHLKGLHNQNSFKYNYALKVTAAHTVDRGVLFDFITSDDFAAVDLTSFEDKLSRINDISVESSEVVKEEEEESRSGEAFVDTNALEKDFMDVEFEVASSANDDEMDDGSDDIDKNGSEEFDSEIIDVEDEREFESFGPEKSLEYKTVPHIPIDKLEESILNSIRVASPIIETGAKIIEENISEEVRQDEVIREIGKSLAFEKGETHSFQEWLSLSKMQPIVRDEIEIETPQENFQQKKNDLIDRFILTNPKIPPLKSEAIKTTGSVFEASHDPDQSYLMTETLARVYLEQHKYQKAIQAYEILILKYPEKSGFFADRILDIKNLQQK